MKRKGFKLLALAVITACCFGISAASAFAAEGETKTAMNGASIRTIEPTGLRFEATVDAATYDGVIADGSKSFGAFILPKDYLTAANITAITNHKDQFVAPAVEKYLEKEDIAGKLKDSVYTLKYSIADLHYYNYNRVFVGMFFIKTVGADSTVSYHYFTVNAANNERSVAFVAKAAVENGSEVPDIAYDFLIAAKYLEVNGYDSTKEEATQKSEADAFVTANKEGFKTAYTAIKAAADIEKINILDATQKPKIQAARKAYDEADAVIKNLLEDFGIYNKFVANETAYQAAEAAGLIETVNNAIAALPEYNVSTVPVVYNKNYKTAKTAYDKLTDEQKQQITNPDKLQKYVDAANKAALVYLKRASELLRQNGVTQLIGMLDVFPKDTGFVAETSKAVPDLNDAHYKEWMESVYLHTKTIVALFPEIKMWEMGNEMNSEVFFHPNGYDASGGLTQGSGGFEWDEHVKVYTDYMYYMTKGIHEVNPQNVAFTGGYAFKNGAIGNYESIAWFIEDTYSLIKSGSAPTTLPESARSKNPRDFFDGLSWHPYATKKDVGVDKRWLDGNNMIYKVAIDNGDEGIPVIFTEFGFHATEEQTELYEKEMEWMETAYEYMLNDMPYVVACCAFRLYRCKSLVSWGGSRQDFWGYFSEDLDGTGNHPREKAYRLQAIYGGTGDLNKYAFCSVRFDTNGGNPVKPQKISVNGKVVQPAAVTRKPDAVNEYEFDGWYYGDRKWNFETDTAKGNMTLTARWKISSSYTNEFLPSGIV